jgi:endonuclease/exonuclease/phosphatase family metal-dependent hydrolase
VVAQNTAIRVSQLQDIAAAASRHSGQPVIIAGDTNLPDLSWALARLLGEYDDAFASAGSGFGYSYPSPRDAWMRIDRILTDKKHFRFRSFEVIHQYISDHFAITSELELVP